MQNYEVIIVGAGPSGCILAYELARAGITVLLLERYNLPRYKCCAGGVTVKVAKILPFDIQEVTEDCITAVEVRYKDSVYTGKSENTLLYTVKREYFDYRLAKLAQEAGALLVQEQVKQIHEDTGRVQVETAFNRFTCKYLVGADGAHGIVSRYLEAVQDYDYVVGINTQLAVTPHEMQRWRGRIVADIGCIPAGYAWVFPKAEHLAAGIATLKSHASNLSRCYTEFLDSLKIKDYSILNKKGGWIPLCKTEPRLYRDSTLLLGDAAGLADPFSGEGIQHAVLSAQLAAEALKQSLLQNSSKLELYRQSVKRQIIPEIRIARFLQGLFIRFPQVVNKLLESNPIIWRGCCLFARGELDYGTAWQRVGGFKGIQQMLTTVLQRSTVDEAE